MLFVVLFAASIKAQSGASLAGTIADENGAVVINADVKLLSIASGRTFDTKTASSGSYQFNGLPLGFYQASVSREGFAVATRTLTLRRVGSHKEDFVLVPGIIQSSITVTAGKGGARVSAETPQSVTISGFRYLKYTLRSC